MTFDHIIVKNKWRTTLLFVIKKKKEERNYHLLRHLLKDVDRDTKLIATVTQRGWDRKDMVWFDAWYKSKAPNQSCIKMVKNLMWLIGGASMDVTREPDHREKSLILLG